ncbi:MAG: sulfatase [Thermoguttaceae bacterium]
MKSFPVFLLGLVSIFSVSSIHANQTTRPNIVMIASDDMNCFIGAFGTHPQVKTPNLDRLVSMGVGFTNAHCQAPLCNPSRISLMTGIRPTTTGVYALEPWFRRSADWENYVTLPQYFEQHGYYTTTCGKVYHDQGPIHNPKFTREFSKIGYAGGFGPKPPEKFVNTPASMWMMDWGPFPEKDEEGEDYRVASWAINELDDLPDDKPFFLSIGLYRPHVPLFAPQKWHDLYPDDSLVLPPYLENDRYDVPDFAWKLHWNIPEVGMKWVQENDQWKPIVRSYLASVSYMDDQIGRILEALEQKGLLENTIIVFWGDNGWHLGQKELFAKTSLWDPATGVPLIFAGPGIKSQGICRQPAELLDIYPTLIDLCGLPENSILEGLSLKPQLLDTKIRRNRPALTSDGPDNHSARSENFRYTIYGDGSEEFYDLREDPNEWMNRIADSNYQKEISELEQWIPQKAAKPMQGSVSRLIERRGDTWFWEGHALSDDDPVPALGRIPESNAPSRSK